MPIPSPAAPAVLDQPPPSPALAGPQIAPMGAMAQPVPSTGMPAPVLDGILQAVDTVSQTLDACAQVTPDLAADWDVVKTALQAVASKLLVSGGRSGPTAAGPNYPGGGFDAGQAGGGGGLS